MNIFQLFCEFKEVRGINNFERWKMCDLDFLCMTKGKFKNEWKTFELKISFNKSQYKNFL